MNRRYAKQLLFGLGLVAVVLASGKPSLAQCGTCATPIVAYQPVVQPTVTYTPDTGWYPGKLFDTWRLRRYGYNTAPATYTATYAPYTAAYAPYTAGYTPYSASYQPYSVGYAPAVATTSYYTPYVTAYAPLGQRQVLMRPVVVNSVASSGCSTCAVEAPCSSCDPCSSCASGVAQASYVEQPCSSCAAGSSTFSAPSSTSQMTAPTLTPQEAAPLRSNYPPDQQQSPDVTPPDPGPVSSSSSTYLEPPKLFSPRDRTAMNERVNRAASVDVWNAVYSRSITAENVSTATSTTASADGWQSVPAAN
jgi:hypothetical protein